VQRGLIDQDGWMCRAARVPKSSGDSLPDAAYRFCRRSRIDVVLSGTEHEHLEAEHHLHPPPAIARPRSPVTGRHVCLVDTVSGQ
jgi:hypothetical protein